MSVLVACAKPNNGCLWLLHLMPWSVTRFHSEIRRRKKRKTVLRKDQPVLLLLDASYSVSIISGMHTVYIIPMLTHFCAVICFDSRHLWFVAELLNHCELA